MAVQSSEESIFLPPNHIFVLLTHSNALDQVHVRIGDDDDVLEVHEESESVAELAFAHQATLTSDRRLQLVVIENASKQLRYVIDVEATGLEGEFFEGLRLARIFTKVFCDNRWMSDIILDRVDETLVHLLAALDVEAFEFNTNIQIFVV